ncbi:DUF3122 domain-containing protein [Microcoleus sp. LEGE 07076]|uniref:DUF3122 domain-containing protein n=1 Tax=Microcoleus sp. LEGE 07076 TaxID=915322 RepID=UPI00187E71D5|nr:DUF3122 domain-containing protein [Microcoleus sp. LEGE 07076]MBE9185100.1 DUF3122 domain-containing protein [Microcoleus sp. LEGE 07076]
MNNLSKKPFFFKALTIISLCLYLTLTFSAPALASIHKYPETADRVMYRSVQSLRDTDDKAWQVVLYKRVKSGMVNSFNLRLVGFPGTELQHPVPLKVAAGDRDIGKANDIWSKSDLPINVGEYDFKSIITQLESNQPLRLNLPVKGQQETTLLVPPFSVREWRVLSDTN